jgi:kynureninase
MPRTVPGMIEGFVEDWQEWGVDAWNYVPNRWLPGSGETVGWWTLPDYLGDRFIAPLLNAPRGTCIHQPHAHWTVSCLLSCDEPFERGRSEVVCTELEFPSVLHAVQRWAGLRPFRPVILPPGHEGYLDVAAVIDSITDRTAAVFVSHVGFTTGQRIPDGDLQAISTRCRETGAMFFVDGYHAACTMPVDVEAIGCDAYFGGLLKEGSGSSGNAYLYVRTGVELNPRLGGWFGEADPFAFDVGSEPHPEIRRRFLGGTTAVASLYHAVEGVRLLLDAGLEEVRDHSLRLTGRAIDRADASGIGLRSPRDASHRSAMVILEVEQADRLVRWLKQHDVYTDSRRGSFLRMAPFVWNTEAEVDYAFDAIVEAVRSRAYLDREHETGDGPVT